MIYIYNDFAGTHSTALAAAYHLKKLPANRKLTKEEVLHVDYFNQLTPADIGRLIFHGKDDDGSPVYTIGRKNSKLVIPVLENFSFILLNHFGEEEKVIFSNTSPTVPWAMTMGGLLSRRLKIDFMGVPLLVLGAKQCCHDILRLVQYTKQVAASTNTRVTVLENKSFT